MGLEFLLPFWLPPFDPTLPLELLRRLGKLMRTMARATGRDEERVGVSLVFAVIRTVDGSKI